VGGDSASEGVPLESAMRSAPPPASGCELVGVKVRRLALLTDGEDPEVEAATAADGLDPGRMLATKVRSEAPLPLPPWDGRWGRTEPGARSEGLPAEETCMARRAGENAAADA